MHNTARRSFWVLQCILEIRLLRSVRKAAISAFMTHRCWHCVWICYEEFGTEVKMRGAVPPRFMAWYLIKHIVSLTDVRLQLLLALTFCFFALNVHYIIIVIFKGAQIFQKSTNSPKIIGARCWREASSIMSTHIFCAALQNLVARRPDELVHELRVPLDIWRLFPSYVNPYGSGLHLCSLNVILILLSGGWLTCSIPYYSMSRYPLRETWFKNGRWIQLLEARHYNYHR